MIWSQVVQNKKCIVCDVPVALQEEGNSSQEGEDMEGEVEYLEVDELDDAQLLELERKPEPHLHWGTRSSRDIRLGVLGLPQTSRLIPRRTEQALTF